MGITKKYQQIIRKELESYEKMRIANAPDVRFHLVVSEGQNEFLLLSFGWKGKQYRHTVNFHLEVKGGKVWIHQNKTDIEIEKDLIDAGIDQSDIVIGLLPKHLREMSEDGSEGE